VSAAKNILDSSTIQGARSGEDARLKYSVYGYFTEYLVTRFGLERLQHYVRDYQREPERYRKIFFSTFGTRFEETVQAFASSS